jgi:hypothetical protein
MRSTALSAEAVNTFMVSSHFLKKGNNIPVGVRCDVPYLKLQGVSIRKVFRRFIRR